MAAREFVALNEATNELQAPQAGDSYVANRPVVFTEPVTFGDFVNGRDPVADAVLLDSALQPGEAATPTQGTTADNAIQPGDSIESLIEGATKLLLTLTERAKLGHITITQAVDLDALESTSAAHAAKLAHLTVTQTVDLDALEAAIVAIQTELSFIAVTQSVDLDTMEAGIAANAAALAIINGHTTGLTAFAGGGQADGTILNQGVNVVTVVATIADSVKLPSVVANMRVTVINRAANSLDLFPNTSDEINALGVNTAYALAAGASVTLYGIDNTTWVSI